MYTDLTQSISYVVNWVICNVCSYLHLSILCVLTKPQPDLSLVNAVETVFNFVLG